MHSLPCFLGHWAVPVPLIISARHLAWRVTTHSFIHLLINKSTLKAWCLGMIGTKDSKMNQRDFCPTGAA